MVTTIIFDFFGVIRTDAFKSWCTLHNYEPSEDVLAAVKQVDRGDISSETLLASLGKITGQTPAEVLDEMENGAALDYHVLDLIKQLKPRYKIGLLSNASSAFIRNILQEYQLEPYFDSVIVSSEVGLIKPEPAIFKLTLRHLNATAQEAIFIDDNQSNVAGAANIGIRSVLYTSVSTLRAELANLGIDTGKQS